MHVDLLRPRSMKRDPKILPGLVVEIEGMWFFDFAGRLELGESML